MKVEAETEYLSSQKSRNQGYGRATSSNDRFPLMKMIFCEMSALNQTSIVLSVLSLRDDPTLLRPYCEYQPILNRLLRYII